MTRGVPAWLLLAAAALAACAGDGDGDPAAPICEAAALEAALAAASPGDVVRVGACRFEGSFTVPGGVALHGEGVEATTFATRDDRPALRLVPDAEVATRVEALTVESSANSGILAAGSGQVALADVAVRTTRGLGIGLQDLDRAVLTRVSLQGAVTEETADDVPMFPDADEWSTHGLVLAKVLDAQLTDVRASGFAQIALLAVDSVTVWTGGGTAFTLANGLVVSGGRARLEAFTVQRTWQGTLLLPAYGAVFMSNVRAETTGLTASDNEGVGVLNDSARVRHVDLAAERNRNAGLWAQGCVALELSGDGTRIADNRFAGVVAARVAEMTLADGRVEATTRAVSVCGETGSVEVGDGVLVFHPTGPLTLRDLALANSARVQLLVELDGGELPGTTFERVTVDGTGTQLGAVVQNGIVPEGWDDGLTRAGATEANDAALAGGVEVLCALGEPGAPAVQAVSDEGLGAIIDPDPGD